MTALQVLARKMARRRKWVSDGKCWSFIRLENSILTSQRLFTTPFIEMSKCTAQANKWHRYENAQNWCRIMGLIEESTGACHRDIPKSYVDGLKTIYGVEKVHREKSWPGG